MRCFWDERQRSHAPSGEFFNGAMHPPAEHAGRVDAILEALGQTEAPPDQGVAPLLRVHPQHYLDFLTGAHEAWRAAGRDGDAFPYTFPIVGRRPLSPSRIDALLGLYSFDTSTPIAPRTWEAAYWSVQTALAAAHAVLAGDRASFALTRPPGHHSGADYLGGYSYLNTAAIVAEQAIAAGRTRIVILDVDYHHGNGTQDIFYDRADVAFASIHADPSTDYPFFWGHADEAGEKDGQGETLNLPLPRGTDWNRYVPALDRALSWLADRQPDFLVVSFGADTYAGDPISHFRLNTANYAKMSRQIAELGLPTVIVMEGGYAIDALGANVAEFLGGF